MSTDNYHKMIRKLRNERYDVGKVYGADGVDTIEEVIELEEDYYIPQRFRDEERSDVAQEIFDIAEGSCIEHLMESAEIPGGIPVLSMEKDLTASQEIAMKEQNEEKTADLVDHIDMGGLIGLMTRNWKALKELTPTEIRNAMKNVYGEINPAVVEAAVDTALHVVRAEAA